MIREACRKLEEKDSKPKASHCRKSHESPMAGYCRDGRITEVCEGTSEEQIIIIASNVLNTT